VLLQSTLLALRLELLLEFLQAFEYGLPFAPLLLTILKSSCEWKTTALMIC
jgi:hypothetical protein